jgi:C4-dicarboxylate transporter, DctM subunit
MSLTAIGVYGLIILLIFLFSNIPIGFAMGFVGFFGFSIVISFDAALSLLAFETWTLFTSYGLTVIPLFILMGQIAFHTGISKGLYKAAYEWLGNKPGGLAMATVAACAGFAAICGSTNAASATMATITIPEMKRYKYSMRLAAGTVAASGTLGILIPPSVILIIYGIMTQQSIGELFAAGIIPGVILSFFFIIIIYIQAKINPSLAPAGKKTTFKEKILSLSEVFETLILFVFIIGGIFIGLFTPTEAAGVGAFLIIIISIIRKQFTFKILVQSLSETAKISCMIMMIVLGATVLGKFLAVTRIPFELATWISLLEYHPNIIMLMIILVYLISGCFMDALAMIMLTIPIFYPIVIMLGFDPIWFGIMIVLVTGMGVITPPVGINVYVVHAVRKDIPLEEIFMGALPMLFAIFALCILLFFVPGIVTFLPSLL